eukprot:gene8822-9767_t
MPKSCFWAISHKGNLLSLDLNSLVWKAEKTNVARQSFKKISSQVTCAWGIGGDQKIYHMVFSSDIPVRAQVSCYENERWSVLGGWSQKSLIFTDRPHWSTEDGEPSPKDSFEVPLKWKWEADWYIDESSSCDDRGWQYAVDFPRTFHKHRGKFSFVRRRKWSRYRYFTGFDSWIRVAWEDNRHDPLQDITTGGSYLPRQASGYLSVWALTFSGKVLYREGICQACPQGEKWTPVFESDDLNLVQIAAGPSGLLWGLQWDGAAVARTGISYQNPLGKSWATIDCPKRMSNSVALGQISVGMNVVWALSQNQKVYYRKGIDGEKAYSDDNYAIGSGWVEMVGEFKFLSVGPNDQVWAVDREDNIVIRTDVVPNEPAGRKWKRIKQSPTASEVNLQFAKEDIMHWIWINSGACFVDTAYFKNTLNLGSIRRNDSCDSFSSKLKEKWRLKLLENLKKRNELQVDRYHTFERVFSTNGSVQYSKRTKCRMQIDKEYNFWCDCHVKFQSAEDDNEAVLLLYYTNRGQYEEIRVPLCEITCVNMTAIPSQPNTFAVNTLERTFRRKALVLSIEDEKEAADWIRLIAIETAKVRIPVGKMRPDKNTVWATTTSGDIFFCKRTSSGEFPLDKMFWFQIGGHMKKVTAGVDGIVWAVGFDGKAYVYSGGEGGGIMEGHEFSTEGIYNQEDTQTIDVYENQRWNPIQGFSDRRFPSDRAPWSDETGSYPCTKEGYRLPSSKWKWDGDWQIAYDSGLSDDDGWQYAVDFPRHYHNYRGINDYVRRRKWTRKCKLKTTGPWELIESDMLLADVAIQVDPGDTIAYCIAVWAVSIKGDVFFRDSVHATVPKGHAWRHVPVNDRFVSISMGSNRRVWGVAADGAAYLRSGFGDDAVLGTQWIRCSGQEISLRQIFVGSDLVLALDEEGRSWRRAQTTRTFPEGTEWIEWVHGLSNISLGCRNDTWIVRGKDVEICIRSNEDNLNGSRMICVLSGNWNTVCIRGFTPDISEADECLDHSCSGETLPKEPSSTVGATITLPRNLLDGGVSIFDLYKHESSSSDSEDDC